MMMTHTHREEIIPFGERYNRVGVKSFARIAFGKSAIHGWGGFARTNLLPGDMVLEYAGELTRHSIIDLREKRIYDEQVGAGTYVFSVDDDFMVDATWAGNMTHILNHSCDPNCYSRVVTVNGKNHVVIFAGRHGVVKGQELTYNYRFGGREKLQCNCGAANCRGKVNYSDDSVQQAVNNDRILRKHIFAAAEAFADSDDE